jgi:hypothetical protein
MSLRCRGEILDSTCMCALRVTCRAHLYVCECGVVLGHTARFTFVSTRKPLNSIALTGILCGHRRKYKLHIHTGRVGPTVLTDIKKITRNM